MPGDFCPESKHQWNAEPLFKEFGEWYDCSKCDALGWRNTKGNLVPALCVKECKRTAVTLWKHMDSDVYAPSCEYCVDGVILR